MDRSGAASPVPFWVSCPLVSWAAQASPGAATASAPSTPRGGDDAPLAEVRRLCAALQLGETSGGERRPPAPPAFARRRGAGAAARRTLCGSAFFQG